MVDVNSTTLHKFTIYETKTRLYIVGSNLSDDGFRILKVDRMVDPTLGLSLVWDEVLYTKTECVELLARIDTGNKGTGGLTKIMAAFGIVGFVKFVEGYYLCVVTKRKAIALLGGHNIYHLEATALLKIENSNKTNTRAELKTDEASYTYDLTNSLQSNLANLKKGQLNLQGPYQDRFVWNQYLLSLGFGSECLNQPNNGWILPLIHGFLDQAKISVLGRSIYVTLIARRSRHFAGTRFLKRGANFLGDVANEVETEQIVNDNLATPLFQYGKDGLIISPRYTSYLQHRGSIPLTWSQDISTMAPKPPIHLAIRDPFAVKAARHFNDLLLRYGAPLIVLNLIKAKEKTPRESKLLKEFTDDVNYLINCLKDKRKLVYIPWDMSRASKSKDQDVISYLEELAEDALVVTKFCHSGPEPYACSKGAEPQYQSLQQTGIVRTNCIDCIDRTNAAQFLIGKGALAHQLHSLGILEEPSLPFDCDAVDMLTEMYHDHGDTLALQYGGSNLVNTMATYRKINQNWTSHSRDIVEAIRRFYTNSFVDAERQEAINLFLGVFRPSPEDRQKLWDLPTDYYLHNPPMDIIHTTRPNYINWWEPESEPKPEPKQNNSLTKNRALVESQTYWDEHYRPHLFTSFSRLLSFNLNSTAHIGHRPNPTLSTSTTTSDLEDLPDTVSPFFVHNSLTPQPLSTTVTTDSLNTDAATVGRFNRWFPANANSKTNTSKSKPRRPNNGRDISGNLRTLSTESTNQLLQSEVDRVLARISDPSLDKETSQRYVTYLDTDRFLESSTPSSTTSELRTDELARFEKVVQAGQGILDPITSTDRKLYISYAHTLKDPDNLGQLSTSASKTKSEAYRHYLRTGKFNPPLESRGSNLINGSKEGRETRLGTNHSTSSFSSSLPNLFTSLSTPN